MQRTSHHRPQCAKWFSRYSISKSGIWARWTSPFCRVSASLSLQSDVTEAILQDIKKWKWNISRVFCLICLKLCMLSELGKGLSFYFKFCCYGNQNQNYCLLLKKQKVQFVWAKVMLKSNLKQYSLIATAGMIKFWRKMGDTLFLLWENNSLLFLNKG